MYDWQRVEGATLFPFRCVACAEQRDVLDTGGQIPQWGQIYLCKNCARTAARLFGFSKGKELDRLSGAAEVLDSVEGERDQYKAERDELQKELMKADLALDEATKENAQLKGRVAQLQSRIAEEAKAALELVGGDAA